MISGPCQAIYLPSSRGTQSQTARAERRIIPCSSEIHRRDQSYKYILGCNAGEKYRWLLERWWKSSIVRYVDKFHKMHRVEWETPDGNTWPRRRLTRKQTTSRPDTLWPEIWKDISDASKLKEKQEMGHRKTEKLDNARKLRGNKFIDPDDGEFKDIMKDVRRKLEVPMPAAKLCKIQPEKYKETSRAEKDCKTKYACISEADESTRMRKERIYSQESWKSYCRKKKKLSHYNLVHKFIPMPHAMKIPEAKAPVDKEWEKLERISAWNLTKVKSKKEVIDEPRNKGRKVHFASFMDLCHLKNSQLEPQIQNYKGRVVPRGDIVKECSGSDAVFTEQRSSASQMTAAKVMGIISRLLGCAGQAADAVSAKTR